MKLRTILATKGAAVVTARATQTIKEATTLLVKHKIGVLLVVDEANQLLGILSERDIIREAAQRDDVLAQPVETIMTKLVITGTPQDDVRSVLQTMTDKRFRHLPILDSGKLAGIISIGDLVKAQLDEYEGEIDSLHVQLTKG